MQPVPDPLFTVTVYTPLATVVADETVAVADVELVIATGPAHKYPVTFDAPLTDRLNVVPAHIGPLLSALVSVGAGLTVTIVV